MSVMDKILNNLDKKSLENIFEYCIDPIIITDANWKEGVKIIYSNRAFQAVTGYTSLELLGRSPKIFQGEKSNYKVLDELKKELIKGNNFTGQSINYKKDGSTYIVKWSISPIKDKSGGTIAYISFQKSIDRAVKLEQDKILSQIVNISDNLILVTDLGGIIVYINDSFCKKLGYKRDELIGKHARVLKSGMQDDSFYKKMWESILRKGKFRDIFISRKKDGTLFYDKKDISTIKDDEGNPVYYVSISTDISKQMKKEKALEKEVFTDSLTKIYNRRKFEQIINQKITRYKNEEKIFSLILIDIDHFKSVNDNYGHDIGDYILQEFAKLVKKNIREDDLFFRWGGEEFALLVDANGDECFKISQKLRIKVSLKSFQSISITASFGVSEISQNIDSNTLFTKADKALYEAKRKGRNQVVVYT